MRIKWIYLNGFKEFLDNSSEYIQNRAVKAKMHFRTEPTPQPLNTLNRISIE